MDDSVGVTDVLTERLEGIQEALKEVRKSSGNPDRLRWLEGQLRNIERQLEHMLLDIDAGMPVSSLGLGIGEDFMTVMDDLGAEIANLRSLIQTCLSLER